ncbi:hypothetical protein GCM10009690_31800 [Brevibacterium permense]|uniref:Uncharacterized protein n=2 Tax=Brevibacterium permense TaxID=234834 RepID=A0ABN2AVI9_9MICO
MQCGLDGNLPGSATAWFSITGAPMGPLSKVVIASALDETVEVRLGSGESAKSIPSSEFFDLLDSGLAGTTVAVSGNGIAAPVAETSLLPESTHSEDLPVVFRLRWVGYLGYELKTEACSPNLHESDRPDTVRFELGPLRQLDLAHSATES